MQLDFQQFLTKLEKLTDIRPIPDKEFVETYIKAYYLTENDMERWIKEHRVRGGRRVLFSVCFSCLVCCVTQNHEVNTKKYYLGGFLHIHTSYERAYLVTFFLLILELEREPWVSHSVSQEETERDLYQNKLSVATLKWFISCRT